MDASEHLRAQFMDFSHPDLYLRNPFRRLALPVLASPRDISRRCDRLRLTCELEPPAGTDGFGLPLPTTVDQIRDAAQLFQDPSQRLFQEFFWFWPLTYPTPNDATDEALLALSHNDQERALSCWSRALGEGKGIAMHNIALYFHLTALTWERANPEEPATRLENWNPAVKFMRRLLDAEEVWTAFEDRLTRLDNPQVNKGFARILRETLPSMLGKLSASFALDAARRQQKSRAEQHSALVLRLENTPEQARLTLEASIDPAVRQNDARVLECRRLFGRKPEQGLAAARSLIEGCQTDLRLIHAFCRDEATRFRELTQNITDAALDAIVAYQRVTGDNRSCVPWLLHLSDRPSSPELSQRISSTFEVVHGNIFDEERGRRAKEESPLATEFRILREVLLSGQAEMAFSKGATRAYRARVASIAEQLGEDAPRKEMNSSMQRQIDELIESLEEKNLPANG